MNLSESCTNDIQFVLEQKLSFYYTLLPPGYCTCIYLIKIISNHKPGDARHYTCRIIALLSQWFCDIDNDDKYTRVIESSCWCLIENPHTPNIRTSSIMSMTYFRADCTSYPLLYCIDCSGKMEWKREKKITELISPSYFYPHNKQF